LEDYEVTQHVFRKAGGSASVSILCLSRIARRNWCRWRSRTPEDDSVVDVYELVINGQEISPGYSELNNPHRAAARGWRSRLGEEIQKIDEEFIHGSGTRHATCGRHWHWH
jgi:lysyl-tRNA synthetase, class II